MKEEIFNKCLDKKSLRDFTIKKRDQIDLNIKDEYDTAIKNQLFKSKYFKDAKNIFIYVGFGSEINTLKYIKEFFEMDKIVLIPRTEIKNKKMEAVKIDNLDDLCKSKYGILEPRKSRIAFLKDDIDLVIVPGLVFDISGNRVGYGGGYYDKFLNSMDKNSLKIALCYEFQIIQNIQSEIHDVKMDYIITEKQIIKCSKMY